VVVNLPQRHHARLALAFGPRRCSSRAVVSKLHMSRVVSEMLETLPIWGRVIRHFSTDSPNEVEVALLSATWPKTRH
jgi:hypothetical protein